MRDKVSFFFFFGVCGKVFFGCDFWLVWLKERERGCHMYLLIGCSQDLDQFKGIKNTANKKSHTSQSKGLKKEMEKKKIKMAYRIEASPHYLMVEFWLASGEGNGNSTTRYVFSFLSLELYNILFKMYLYTYEKFTLWKIQIIQSHFMTLIQQTYLVIKMVEKVHFWY